MILKDNIHGTWGKHKINVIYSYLTDYSVQYSKSRLVSMLAMAVFLCVNFLANTFFFIFFFIEKVPQMCAYNLFAMIAYGAALFILLKNDKILFAAYIIVFNVCFYVLYSSYLLGYEKNSISLLLQLVLSIHLIFPISIKQLSVQSVLILLTYFLTYLTKYTDSPYSGQLVFVEIANIVFAILSSIFVVYTNKVLEKLVNDLNVKKLEALEKEVCTDFLTGLKNRRYIEKMLAGEEWLCNSYVALADIDHFKKINDTYGHLCGDYVLKKVAQIFQNNLMATDVVARWGGEEFLFFMKSINSTNVAIENLERLRMEIQNTTFQFNDVNFNITVTFGLKKIKPEISIEENIEAADTCLYHGKNNGRNQVVYL